MFIRVWKENDHCLSLTSNGIEWDLFSVVIWQTGRLIEKPYPKKNILLGNELACNSEEFPYYPRLKQGGNSEETQKEGADTAGSVEKLKTQNRPSGEDGAI